METIMRKRNGVLLLLFAAAASAASAQADTSSKVASPRPEVALNFAWVHTNAPTGACGCFSILGGGGSFAWPVSKWHFSPLVDVAVTSNSSTSLGGSPYSLTLTTVTAGGRYFVPAHMGRFAAFGEGLIGLAHASGTLAQPPNPASTNAQAALAAQLGGGLDLNTSPRLALRLLEADYLYTGFNNSADNHQNNVRLSAGIVLRF
jgi:outer membrane immunogenic protein